MADIILSLPQVKAAESGSVLSGGVGSNPIECIFLSSCECIDIRSSFVFSKVYFSLHNLYLNRLFCPYQYNNYILFIMIPWIFPSQGGGWARRYLAYRKDILRTSLLTKDRYPCPPLTLFDFSRHDDAVDAARVGEYDSDAWRISDDRVIGGFSRAQAAFLKTPQDVVRFNAGEELSIDSKESNEEASDPKANNDTEEENKDRFIPFLRWQGTLDTTIGLQSMAQRSGFAALRSPEFPFSGANLQGLYNALEVTCRTDGRRYTFNLKVSTSIPNDIYQGQIQSRSKPNTSDDETVLPFERFILPFSNLSLTSMGREREVFRELDDNVCIESVGLALMDGENGGFLLDLAKIRAVNVHEEYGVFEGV